MNKEAQHPSAKHSIQQDNYLVTNKLDLVWLMSELDKNFDCSLETTHDFTRVFYDTFDWRLYRQGQVLFYQAYKQENKLFLLNKDSGTVKEIAPLLKSIQFNSVLDLPLSRLRDKVAPIILMRALLSVVRIKGEMQKLVLRNKDEKIVVRLSIEQNCIAFDDDVRQNELPIRIIIEPVRGYQSEQRNVEKILKARESFDTGKYCQLDMALQSIGRHACDYSSKMNIELDPSTHSGRAVKTVLQQLLEALNANEEGVLKNIDSEFLHDYRVAVRRVRSILTQMKGTLPRDKFEYFKKEFSWLGAVTTPARDLDVYLLEFDKLQNSLLPEIQSDLLPFKDFLLVQQQNAYADLRMAVKSQRYVKLKQSLKTFLRTSTESYKNAPNAAIDIKSQANDRIRRSYHRVIKEASQLTPDSPAYDFHELRKSCKKLRYLLEFFQCLYPAKEMKELVQKLKLLQDNLGEFQDMDVQSNDLHRFAKMMVEQGVNSPNTFMAMGVLAEGMAKNKNELRYEFVNCYKKFSRKRYRDIFDNLFKPVENLAENTIGKIKQELVDESIS